MKDARGHGSNGSGFGRIKRSDFGISNDAHFSGKTLAPRDMTPTQKTVADLRSRLATAGPGHSTGLMQGIRNLLGG